MFWAMYSALTDSQVISRNPSRSLAISSSNSLATSYPGSGSKQILARILFSLSSVTMSFSVINQTPNPAFEPDPPAIMPPSGRSTPRSASASPPPPSSMRILCKVLRCSLLAASIELKLGTRAQTSRSRKPHTPAQTLPASLVLHNFGSFRFRYFFANVHY